MNNQDMLFRRGVYMSADAADTLDKAECAARAQWADMLMSGQTYAHPSEWADTIAKRVVTAISADIWDKAYEQGAADQRTAFETALPEYPTANRVNPYGR